MLIQANSTSMFCIIGLYAGNPPIQRASDVNPLRAKFCRGNINIYLHFASFLHIDATQVVEILPQIRQEHTYSISAGTEKRSTLTRRLNVDIPQTTSSIENVYHIKSHSFDTFWSSPIKCQQAISLTEATPKKEQVPLKQMFTRDALISYWNGDHWNGV